MDRSNSADPCSFRSSISWDDLGIDQSSVESFTCRGDKKPKIARFYSSKNNLQVLHRRIYISSRSVIRGIHKRGELMPVVCDTQVGYDNAADTDTLRI
jgi:hypothetical protein